MSKCPFVYVKTDWGSSQESLTVTPSVGPKGPIIITAEAFQVQQRFDRERIPERIVHAKGGVAFGRFVCMSDILEKYTDMTILKNEKETDVAVRFSTVAGERGSSDTVRDPRGFAVKFYGDEGNWDLVGNNTPVFFIRDPALFPLFIHSQKRGRDGLRSVTSQWDFFSQRPETMMQLVFMFTQRGIPDGFRHMDGFGSHTYILHKTREGKPTRYTAVKFRWVSRQGIKGFSGCEGNSIAGSDPDYAIRDLIHSIEQEKYPQWDLYVQLLPFPKAECFPIDITDLTKIWPTTMVCERFVGRMTLNQNPKDNFVQAEQLAFCPGTMVRGIGPSNDRMLQMRLLTYKDTQMHRLGPNFLQLEVNRPRQKPFNFNIDGDMNNVPSSSAVYFPNTVCPTGVTILSEGKTPTHLPYPNCFDKVEVGFYDTKDADNFSQPRMLYLTMDCDTRNDLAYNFAQALKAVLNENKSNSKEVVCRAVSNFGKVCSDLKYRVKSYLHDKTPTRSGPPVECDTGYEFMLPSKC